MAAQKLCKQEEKGNKRNATKSSEIQDMYTTWASHQS